MSDSATPRTIDCRALCPWDFPSNNTEVGIHSLLQGIFPTQGSNPCFLYWQVGSLLLSHQEVLIIYTLTSCSAPSKSTLEKTPSPFPPCPCGKLLSFFVVACFQCSYPASPYPSCLPNCGPFSLTHNPAELHLLSSSYICHMPTPHIQRTHEDTHIFS